MVSPTSWQFEAIGGKMSIVASRALKLAQLDPYAPLISAFLLVALTPEKQLAEKASAVVA
jgi:hypothetical protein